MSDLLHTCRYSVITAAALCFAATSTTASAEEVAEVSRGDRMAKLIEALASRNGVPAIEPDKPGEARGRAVFPEKYDWDEQSRVFAAIDALFDVESADAWGELVKHLEDSRYCVTLALDGEPNWARNFSAGDICQTMAYAELEGVLTKRVPRVDGYPLKVRLDGGLVEWCKKRPGEPLYKLQIEICELARIKVESLKRLSGERRTKMNQALEELSDELNRTRVPVSSKSTLYLFYTDIWHPARTNKRDRSEVPPMVNARRGGFGLNLEPPKQAEKKAVPPPRP